MCVFAVQAEAGRFGQPEREPHDGGDPHQGRERQPPDVRPAHLRDTDHGGGRPKPAQESPAGPLALLFPPPHPHGMHSSGFRRMLSCLKCFRWFTGSRATHWFCFLKT
ncbi:hypothetical protein CDAR_74091 [Caerostris darwini]|uniref:Uncharacterized protein n=1 Tax=Caerostris darwini TaxID=1538125 RepID=A0AAV4Q8C4_9ARAC|nr:hypothetical protein CDAR_74091 [Caerostris darwini]